MNNTANRRLKPLHVILAENPNHYFDNYGDLHINDYTCTANNLWRFNTEDSRTQLRCPENFYSEEING